MFLLYFLEFTMIVTVPDGGSFLYYSFRNQSNSHFKAPTLILLLQIWTWLGIRQPRLFVLVISSDCQIKPIMFWNSNFHV